MANTFKGAVRKNSPEIKDVTNRDGISREVMTFMLGVFQFDGEGQPLMEADPRNPGQQRQRERWMNVEITNADEIARVDDLLLQVGDVIEVTGEHSRQSFKGSDGTKKETHLIRRATVGEEIKRRPERTNTPVDNTVLFASDMDELDRELREKVSF